MDNLADIGTGTVGYNGILISNGTNDVENNIVYSAEGDFANYCINRTGTTGTLVSNYNDFYPGATNGNVGFWNDAATSTLSDWKTVSGQDANSVSKSVTFASETDLHLSGSSNGDTELRGTTISIVTKDIDGELRSTLYPYMGADEGSVALPVEITTFEANVNNGVVTLKWSTASEKNNQGFEIERKSNNEFIKIGFVKGSGSTTQIQNYNFVDKQVENESYSYRLRQIDFDGTSSYSNVVEVKVASIAKFDLGQNYPNPFNPTTTIQFSLPNESAVTLSVYNVLGQEVAVLIRNQVTEAGSHSVVFNATNFASGTYIYRLQTDNQVLIKKMILAK